MSFALDANILVYASAEGAPQHASASAFLRDCVRGPEVFYIAWPTLMAYLRLVTHPRILNAPLTAQQAERNIDSLLAVPQCRTLSEQEGFWSVYLECTKGLAVRGNAVPDAYLAALLKQNGVSRSAV